MWWDFTQEIRLNDLRKRQSDASARATEIGGDIADVTSQVQKMALVNQALYEILKERVGITDEELRRKIREIDLRDGKEDFRATPKPVRCPKCGNMVAEGSLNCKQCGATVAPKYPFEG